MKTLVIASFFVVSVSACCISPEWTTVAAKSKELEDTFSNATKYIASIASNENTAVGIIVEAKIHVASLEASFIFDRINQDITAKTLTEPETKVLVGQLRGTFARLKGSIQIDIVKLTPESAAHIRTIFDATFDAIGMRAEELYALLH